MQGWHSRPGWTLDVALRNSVVELLLALSVLIVSAGLFFVIIMQLLSMLVTYNEFLLLTTEYTMYHGNVLHVGARLFT